MSKLKRDVCLGIKDIRMMAGLSLEELHYRTGISLTLLSNYENHIVCPGLNNIDKIAKACGREALFIFNRVEILED